MKFQLVTKPLSEIKSDILILPIFEGEKTNINGGLIDQFLTDNPKFGKPYEIQLLYSKTSKILLIGIGQRDKIDYATLQNWSGTAIRSVYKKYKQISILLPQIENLSSKELSQAVVIGSEIASYESGTYKSDLEPNKLVNVELIIRKAETGFQDGIKEGQTIVDSINLARSLSDMPPNIMTPTYFLNTVKNLSKELKLKTIVLDEKLAAKKGMGAFAAVSKGSDEPSFMIALEYTGNLKSKEKWGIVGKGITLDSGGLSLKPADAIPEMKYDMCGAANALAVLICLAKLAVKTNAVAIMAVTENMPSGKALKPSDIVKAYCEKNIEILNTDAEGRLVLIDGLSFAQKDLKATKLIDIATLTGAMIVALGDLYTGVFGNNHKFSNELIDISSKVGEKLWEMPMDEMYQEYNKSEFADIQNIGGGSMGYKTAGSITAAKFLEIAIEKNTPWIHLDIAGTALDLKPKPYRSVGAVGATIKTLVKLISND